MGVLNDADWQAKWIGAADTNIPSLLLRREFAVKPGLKRALVNVCGLGQYELTLNGKKVGDDFLSPGWTKYDKTCLYDTRDITADLKRGKNAAGIELGNGMYNVLGDAVQATKLHQTRLARKKPSRKSAWNMPTARSKPLARMKTGALRPARSRFSSIYGGEDFDARLVQNGWNETNFDDSKWPPRNVVSGPGGELRGLSCAAPPIRFFEIHQPVSSRTLTNGDVVFDLGQNAAHVPKISVTGPAGSRVRIDPVRTGDGAGRVKVRWASSAGAPSGANSPRRRTARKRGRRNFSTSAAVIWK